MTRVRVMVLIEEDEAAWKNLPMSQYEEDYD